jgi:hypothetical protein
MMKAEQGGTLKDGAIFQIRLPYFSSLFRACLYPETGDHFREACRKDSFASLI